MTISAQTLSPRLVKVYLWCVENSTGVTTLPFTYGNRLGWTNSLPQVGHFIPGHCPKTTSPSVGHFGLRDNLSFGYLTLRSHFTTRVSKTTKKEIRGKQRYITKVDYELNAWYLVEQSTKTEKLWHFIFGYFCLKLCCYQNNLDLFKSFSAVWKNSTGEKVKRFFPHMQWKCSEGLISSLNQLLLQFKSSLSNIPRNSSKVMKRKLSVFYLSFMLFLFGYLACF